MNWQILDEGKPVVFDFVYYPDTLRFAGNQDFLDHFEGRTSGRDALRALGMAVEKRTVSFPIELRQTGTTNKFLIVPANRRNLLPPRARLLPWSV